MATLRMFDSDGRGHDGPATMAPFAFHVPSTPEAPAHVRDPFVSPTRCMMLPIHSWHLLRLSRVQRTLSVCDFLGRRLFVGSYLLEFETKDLASEDSKFVRYAQIALADAAAIHSSLAELGPGFVICNFYDEMGDEDQAQEIADFLSPNEVVAGYLKDALLNDVHQRPSASEELPYADASAVTARIQQKLNTIEAQHCGHRASRKR